jgi:hypothetical protein
MTNVGRNMLCAYTGDTEDILKLQTSKGLKRKLHVTRLVTRKECINCVQQDVETQYYCTQKSRKFSDLVSI